MNKEIVCVAPDGSLEVWKRIKYYETITNDFSVSTNFSHLGTFKISPIFHYTPLMSPEFWGREVLGDL